MIIIVAKYSLKPDKKNAFVDIAGELIEKSRAEEGCISYRLCESTDNPDVVAFIEEWKDRAAIDFHNGTEHYKRLVPQLAELRNDKDVSLYTEI